MSQARSLSSKHVVSLDSPRNADDRAQFLRTDRQASFTSRFPGAANSSNVAGHVNGHKGIYDFGVGSAFDSGSVTPPISNATFDVSKTVEDLQSAVASNKEMLCDIATAVQDGFQDLRRSIHIYQPSYMTEEARPTIMGMAMEEMFVEIKEMMLQQQRQHREDIHNIHAVLLSVEKGDKQREANIKTTLINLLKEHRDMTHNRLADNEKHLKETFGKMNVGGSQSISMYADRSEASSAPANSRPQIPADFTVLDKLALEKQQLREMHPQKRVSASKHIDEKENAEKVRTTQHLNYSGKYALKNKVQNYISKLQFAERQSNLALYAQNESENAQNKVSTWRSVRSWKRFQRHFHSGHHSHKIVRKEAKLFHGTMKAGSHICLHCVRLVESQAFQMLTVLLIVTNAVWVGIVADRKVKEWVAGRNPDAIDDEYAWAQSVSNGFTLIFALEVVIRMSAYRYRFFITQDWCFNMIDLFVVILGILQIFEAGSNLTVLRLLRLFKVIRIFRVIRVMRCFNDLRVIISTLKGGAALAVWWFCVYSLWCFLFALCILETLLSHADRKDVNKQAIVNTHFGSLLETLRTLFVASTGGEGYNIIQRHMAELELASITVLLNAYVIPIMYCLLPVVFAAFVLKVFDISRLDTYVALHRRTYLASCFAADLQSRLIDMHYSLEDVLTIETLDEVLNTPDLELFFEAHALALNAEDTFELFDAEAGGTITVSQFIYGCQYVFLEGSNFDQFGQCHLSEQVVRLHQTVQGIQDRTKDMVFMVSEVFAEVHKQNMDKKKRQDDKRLSTLINLNKEALQPMEGQTDWLHWSSPISLEEVDKKEKAARAQAARQL